MDISKGMPGAYTRKFFSGQLFPEKTIDDFDGKEKEYDTYLKSIEKNEYVILREPSLTEMFSLIPGDRLSDDDKKVLAMANPEGAADILRKENKSGTENLASNRSAVENCIAGSSIMKNGEWAGAKETMDVYMTTTSRFNWIFEKFQELAQGFQKKKAGK